MSYTFNNLMEDIIRLKKCVQEDSAGAASSVLHKWRKRFEELTERAWFMCYELHLFDNSEMEIFREEKNDVGKLIAKRLQDRIYWMAKIIDGDIEKMKKNGTYKGQFTTSVIIANAFNDIFDKEIYFEG